MTLVLLKSGQLHIYNSMVPEKPFEHTNTFTEVEAVTATDEWSTILHN